MNGHQITMILQRDPVARHQFGGVLAADELPTDIRRRPTAYVVNTDVRGLPGTHWTIFYFPKRGPSEFFDSLGRRPEYYRGTFKGTLRRHGPKYVYNKRRVQSRTSNACGQYCIDYVLRRCRGWDMNRIVRRMANLYM